VVGTGVGGAALDATAGAAVDVTAGTAVDVTAATVVVVAGTAVEVVVGVAVVVGGVPLPGVSTIGCTGWGLAGSRSSTARVNPATPATDRRRTTTSDSLRMAVAIVRAGLASTMRAR
jgi:hypothetical protein